MGTGQWVLPTGSSDDIDLSKKEWANFDHLSGKFVKITEFEFNFVRGKQVKNYLQSLKN